MNAVPVVHPSDQALYAYGLGQLDAAAAQSVHAHLDGCPDCRRRIGEAGSGSVHGRLRDAGSQPDSFRPAVSSTDGLSLLDRGAAVAPPPPAGTLPPGLADHPNYEILRELGRGGMGVVYLAENTLMGRKEVLKVVGSHLVSRPGVLDRFLREIRSAAQLHHTNIVTAYTALRLGESLVLAMEYVEGLDLSRMVKARGPLPVANASNYVQQAALGLQHAHEHGMVHRDIKPGNLMLSRQGNRAVVKVLDFGLAKVQSEGAVDGGLTHEGQMLGTPDYIAPEQISNARDADIRADIYSLGCTLYYLLTAKPPFQGTSLYDILQAHHSMEATPLNLLRPEVPVEVAAIAAKMMAKEPERRFQEPKQVAQALKPFFQSGNVVSLGSKPDISRTTSPGPIRTTADAGPVPTRPAASPSQPAPDPAPVLPPPVVRPAETSRAVPEWESLIVFEGAEQPTTPTATAMAPLRRRPPWVWQAIVATSVLGALAMGVIIITVRDKEGREISKTIVPDGAHVVVEDSHKKVETKTSEAGRDDAAGGRSPVPVVGQAGTPTVSPSTASPADALRPGTSWRGTSTLRFRSSTTIGVGQPRPLWLTIRAREGTRFKAIAESPRGSHDVEGTFQEGVIEWKVAREDYSWEGKLDGHDIVGTFQGTNWQGPSSGEFRLTVAENVPPRASPARIPPVGPARGALFVGGKGWAVQGDQLINVRPDFGFVGFGDPEWTDYDLTFEARRSTGPDGLGACFRVADGKQYVLILYGFGNKHIMRIEKAEANRGWIPTRLDLKSSSIQPLEWYRVKISLRGQRIRVELDDQLLFSCTDDGSPKGAVQLRCQNSTGRFRNIKVSDSRGTVLWEGPPDLP